MRAARCTSPCLPGEGGGVAVGFRHALHLRFRSLDRSLKPVAARLSKAPSYAGASSRCRSDSDGAPHPARKRVLHEPTVTAASKLGWGD
jgi:hypothetical protein